MDEMEEQDTAPLREVAGRGNGAYQFRARHFLCLRDPFERLRTIGCPYRCQSHITVALLRALETLADASKYSVAEIKQRLLDSDSSKAAVKSSIRVSLANTMFYLARGLCDKVIDPLSLTEETARNTCSCPGNLPTKNGCICTERDKTFAIMYNELVQQIFAHGSYRMLRTSMGQQVTASEVDLHNLQLRRSATRRRAMDLKQEDVETRRRESFTETRRRDSLPEALRVTRTVDMAHAVANARPPAHSFCMSQKEFPYELSPPGLLPGKTLHDIPTRPLPPPPAPESPMQAEISRSGGPTLYFSDPRQLSETASRPDEPESRLEKTTSRDLETVTHPTEMISRPTEGEKVTILLRASAVNHVENAKAEQVSQTPVVMRNAREAMKQTEKDPCGETREDTGDAAKEANPADVKPPGIDMPETPTAVQVDGDGRGGVSNGAVGSGLERTSTGEANIPTVETATRNRSEGETTRRVPQLIDDYPMMKRVWRDLGLYKYSLQRSKQHGKGYVPVTCCATCAHVIIELLCMDVCTRNLQMNKHLAESHSFSATTRMRRNG